MEKQHFDVDYEEDKHIDENNLHVEWLEQSEITQKYVYHCAEKRLNRDNAKEELSFVYAELDKQIREDPKAFGLQKATDNPVHQAIIRQEKYQDAIQKYNKARYEVTIAEGALQDMRDRKGILEGLNFLYSTGYFSSPNENKDISNDRNLKKEQEAAKQKEMDDEITKNLNQKSNDKK